MCIYRPGLCRIAGLGVFPACAGLWIGRFDTHGVAERRRGGGVIGGLLCA